MKREHLILLLLSFGISSCSVRKHVIITGDQSDAIKIAINDFLNTSKLIKDDNVFSIRWIETETTWNICILGNEDNKVYLGPEDTIGHKSRRIPAHYIEKEGKLFYWRDSTQTITNEIIAVLSKYNHLDSTYIEGFNGVIPNFIRDDTKKSAQYYFCKNDLSNYKKVITNIAMGWYKAPKLKCTNSKRKKQSR